MPNDLPDWTSQLSVQLVAATGALEGDVSGGGLAPDAITETVQASQPLTAGNHVAVLASFKAAAGLTPALRGALGARADGTNLAVTPGFGQATAAGNFLLAWVSAEAATPATASAGWALVVNSGPSPTANVALFSKPNCGAAEAAPTFTCVGGTGPMRAVLAEFTGVLAAAPTDRITSGGLAGSPGTLTSGGLDTAFGELVAYGFGWQLTGAGTATFSDSMNNRAVTVAAGSDGALSSTVKHSFGFGVTVAPTAALPLGMQTWPYDVSGQVVPAVGTIASVVLAASPGKAYTCHHLSGSILATTAASQQATLQLKDGAAVIWSEILATTNVIGSCDHTEPAGLGYRGTPGNSMTIAFNQLAAGGQESVSIGAYLR